MKSAAQVFYLAFFALLGSSQCETTRAASKPKTPAPDVCAINPKAVVSDACATYSTLDSLNAELKPALNDIIQTTDFFAYYRLNLFNKECPFWNDANSMCGNIACAVTTLENEEDVPEIWKSKELGKLAGPKAIHPGRKLQEERGPERPLDGGLGEDVGESCVMETDDECDERDYCVPEDESATAKGDYVSLVDNPERFTGYSGDGASMVWDSIYKENCFSRASFPHSAELGKPPFIDGLAAQDLKSVLFKQSSGGGPELGIENEDECLEKRVFYRIISGMHASISTHICWEYLNQSTGEWSPNLSCYIDRLHTHPERIANLYFNYALVLRAVAKLDPYLQSYTFCSGDVVQDRNTKRKVKSLTAQAAAIPQIFDESSMFVNGEGPSLKEDFKYRFRNVSRLMDCVGCDKCRLWGKVQTSGYGTALKVLFEFQDPSIKTVQQPQLKRTELVALFNTLARISSSLTAVEKFRGMVGPHENGHLPALTHPIVSDRARLPHNVVIKDRSAKTGDEEFEVEGEEEDDEEMQELRQLLADRQTRGSMSVKQEFIQEFTLIWKTFRYIIRGYIKLPGIAWNLFTSELKYQFDRFVGLPVQRRIWKIRGIRDEL